MKADIPNRLIISRDKDGKLHHSYWTTDQHLVPFEDTEYIRKDFLLEWAESKMKEYALKSFEKNGDATHWGQRNAFQQVIDKINSL